MLTTAIPDNGVQLYCMLCTVQSAITATAELLVVCCNHSWQVIVLFSIICEW